MNTRRRSRLDEAIEALDDAIRTVFGPPPRADRANPADRLPDHELKSYDRELAGRLMRVNHAGEICAQALYRGQAVTARSAHVRETMKQAAAEENDHLAWTKMRIGELGAHISYLNPLWYAGSFMLGAVAGLVGDRWNLGFVAETERQVVAHLDGHLRQLAASDEKSKVILEQMKADEHHHATVAIEAGAAPLPSPVQQLMRFASQCMTRTAYWI